MKRARLLVAAAGIIAAAATASYAAGIKDSKHDFSKASVDAQKAAGNWTNLTAGASSQICIYCHAPHNAAKSLPLWNRSNPDAATFTLYSGIEMENVSFRDGFTADSMSLFCMSCHDGNIDISAVHNAGVIEGSYAGGTAVDAVDPVSAYRTAVDGRLTKGKIGVTKNGAIGGSNLSKTHPINFEVATDNISQSDLHVGSGKAMGTTNQFPLFKAGDRSETRSLECSSCHAVHDATISPFLRVSMDGSKLCLDCHNK